MSETVAASSKRRGIGFSPARVWTLATATVTQLLRMKILGFLLLFCVLVVALGFAFPAADPSQQMKQLKDWSFAALQVFSVVIAIVATSLLLPRDLEDRTLYTILAKPVPRYEYLLGKLLGVLLLIGAGLVIMDIAFSAVLWLRQNLLEAQAAAMLRQTGADATEALAQYRAMLAKHGLTWNLHFGVLAVFLKASVISALALMISCFSSSTLFTVIMTLLVTIVGHGHQLMREYFLHPNLPAVGEKILSIFLAIITPDLGAFDVVENIISGEVVAMGAMSSMLGVTGLYLTAYMVVSHLLFVEKEL
jgi:ABC-type transport system involved in multi-copper enzyme maturation permease subunit